MNSVDALVQSASQFLVSLRQGRGVQQCELDELVAAIERFCADTATSNVVSKDAARTLVDLIPTLDATTTHYSGDEALRIRDASALLFDLILTKL